ncbi:glycerol-3-phosphate 1-O-acyltransferase PlsY [Roseicyclus sp. F158]|uniref:Glycerol-3-phosphate acyltransferase n=1 Tax=Tropicimonas omnivorans TaxID=3075590 RepID=A0ABU3DC74_9RHOB|nr:glycerol-3-phosphate 1-O-acyltransferase PlsY [Roseicyclus sp. F158]MDT0681303.1 glycerol-3-phosphate 1-O-acyltransferase PlsY [Roseicyclus sp. F158]
MPVIDTPLLWLAVTALLSYLAGSVPFGVVMARVFGLGDLRKVGSGNTGATNVLRTGNKGAAALTLLLDGAKGAAAVLIARALMGEDGAQVAALFAFAGHIWSVLQRFNGGKGVATFLGVMLALAWPVGLACCATWLLVAATTRYSSLAALVAAALSAIYVLFLDNGESVWLSIALTILIYIRHAANISRLKLGTEPKIGRKSVPEAPHGEHMSKESNRL